MNKVVLLCRPGFEKECAAEITDKAGQREIFGFARVKENAGYVIYECYQPDDGDKLIRELPFSSLILPASGLWWGTPAAFAARRSYYPHCRHVTGCSREGR